MSGKRVKNVGNGQVGTVVEEQVVTAGDVLLGGEIQAEVHLLYVDYEALDEDHPARKGWVFPHMVEEL